MSKERVCELLNICRSGYYQWVKKLEVLNKDAEISELIYNLFHYHKGRYGSRRICYLLRNKGFVISRKKVQRIMRELSLVARGTRKFKKTTNSNHKKKISPNLINGCFAVNKPNKLWVADITYIRTKEGWMYLNVVLDCYDRRVVSWKLQNTMDKSIVSISVLQALKEHKPAELIFHSDRGVQYASNELRAILQKYKVNQSMSGKGNCYDNAVAESFFKTLKRELPKRSFSTRKEAELEIFEYLEAYYNTKRIHSFNNYQTPNQMFENYKNSA